MLNVNDEIKIEVEESAFSKRQMGCKILEVTPETLVLDYSPISPYYYQFLHEGQELKFYSYSSDGINIYESIIINSPVEGKFEIELPATHLHIQRREYVRVNVVLDMQVIDPAKGSVVEKTQTINITGNGIKFVSKSELALNKTYDVILFLSNTDFVKVKGVVIKSDRTTCVIEFSEISDADRDRILKLCFEMQLKSVNRKKNSLL